MDSQKHLAVRLRFLHVVTWVVFVSAFLWIAWKNVSPNGNLTIRYQPSRGTPPPLLKNFASKEPNYLIGTTQSQEVFQELTTTPVYFSIPTARDWTKATLRMLYDNPDKQPIIQIGFVQNDGKNFLKTVSTIDERLETLLPYWVPIRESDIVVWQKNVAAYEAYQARKQMLEKEKKAQEAVERQQGDSDVKPIDILSELNTFPFEAYAAAKLPFAAVEDFLTSPPPPQSILTFDYPLPQADRLPGYKPRTQRTFVRNSLRGTHSLVVYVGQNETLDFRFFFRDINRHKNNDDVTVTVKQGNSVLFSEIVADDGIHDSSGSVLPEREYVLSLPQLREGVYRIKLETTDDTFLTHFDTLQHMFYFESSVYLTDNDEYAAVLSKNGYLPTNLVTNSTTLTASTSHEAGLQVIRADKRTLSLRQIHKETSLRNLSGVTELFLPKNDVILRGGAFAFSREQLFLPRLASSTSLDQSERGIDEYDFIIANYPGVKQREGHFVIEETLIMRDAKHDDEYDMLVNLPGLAENRRRFWLYDFSVTLQRQPITLSNFLERFSAFVRKTYSAWKDR